MNINDAVIGTTVRGEGADSTMMKSALSHRAERGNGSVLTDIMSRNNGADDSFRRRYEAIVKTNRAAQDGQDLRDASSMAGRDDAAHTADSSIRKQIVGRENDTGRSHEEVKEQETIEPVRAYHEPVESAAAKVNPDKVETSADTHDERSPQESVQDASASIAGALQAVTQLLGVVPAQGLESLDLGNAGAKTVDQMAEILTALKGIAGVVEEHLKNQTPLELNGKVLTPAQMESLSQSLRQQTFKIEYSLMSLGIAGEVNSKILEKAGAAGQGGIVQAIDPATRAMSVLDLRKLLKQNDQAKTATGDANEMVKRLAALLRKDQVESAGVTVFSVKPAATDETASLKELGATDPRSLHTQLKLDAGNAAAAENADAAARNKKMDLPKVGDINFGKSLFDQQARVDEAKLDASVLNVGKAKADGTVVFAATRIAHPVYVPESAIMNQVTDRFNAMLKSGVHEIRMLLKPESMGEVRIKIQVEGDVVTTRIQVESQQIKQIIESGQSNLKNALAEHNLQTGAFSVDVGGHPFGRDAATEENPSGQVAKGAHDENAGDGRIDSAAAGAAGSGVDTGIRYGNNTVEYFG